MRNSILTALFASTAVTNIHAASDKPNVIYIIMDDLGLYGQQISRRSENGVYLLESVGAE